MLKQYWFGPRLLLGLMLLTLVMSHLTHLAQVEKIDQPWMSKSVPVLKDIKELLASTVQMDTTETTIIVANYAHAVVMNDHAQ
uniref:Putative secreted protein n=1 Tax=Panstrongylus lignarius TaxID=156445 RepID=A0A224XSJ3_9HEMI